MAPNKTDANDADGLAHLAEVGFFPEVRVKGSDSMLTRTLVGARTRLVRITTELSNQICGIMKTFGLLVPAGKGAALRRTFGVFLSITRNLGASSLQMHVRARHAACSCRSLASAPSPQPRSPLP